MLPFDFYIMLRADRTIDVYDRQHSQHGAYSTIAKCQELLMPWVISQGLTVGVLMDGKWVPLMDDADWVLYLLSKQT